MSDLNFQEILYRFAAQAQVTLDATTGLPAPSREEEHRFTIYLNEAAAWVWRSVYQQWTLPEMITGATVTLATGGIIEAADIDDATFWTVWDTDPRLELPEDRQRLQKRATAKANGDLIVEDGTVGATVFVIYRIRVPKWSAVLSDVPGDPPEQQGTRIWFKAEDGNVYRSVPDANNVHSDYQNPANWLPVTLPETLLEPLIAKALANKFLSDGQPAPAAALEEQAIAWMESRALEAEKQPREKPWLYNQNV